MNNTKEPKTTKRGGKTKKQLRYDNVGRKISVTPEVVKLLTKAFSIGCSVNEACLYANISKPTFYKHFPVDSKMFNHFMSLRDKPLMKARINIEEAVQEGDLETSKWYAERKAKDEFSTKVDSKQDTNITISLSSNRKK